MPYHPPETTLIACIWMPRFEIQVERSRSPDLAGLPLAILSIGSQPAIVACSREAQAAGVRSGMPLREATAIAPHLVLRFAAPALYEELFARTLANLQAISPEIEPAAPGHAYINLEGIYRAPRQLMGALERIIPPPWSVRIGIAEGKFTAWAAARAADGTEPGIIVSQTGRTFWVPAARTGAFLKPLSVQLLPLSEGMRRKLRIFGIRTLDALGSLPLRSMVAQFGKEGQRAWKLAHGQDADPLWPQRLETALVETLSFDVPESSLEAIIVVASLLLHRLLGRSELGGRAVRQVRLEAALESRSTWSAIITLRQPGNRLEQIFPSIRYRLERDHPTEGVEALSLFITVLPSSPGGQGSLFPEPAQVRQARIKDAAQQLRLEMGYVPIGRIVEVEPWSRIPERRHQLFASDP